MPVKKSSFDTLASRVTRKIIAHQIFTAVKFDGQLTSVSRWEMCCLPKRRPSRDLNVKTMFSRCSRLNLRIFMNGLARW